MGNTPTTPNAPAVDMKALQAEVDKLDNSALKEQLLKIRVRQKKQQAKMQGSASQKAYQQKQKELRKLLKLKAQQLGIYDEINEEAKKQADAELAAEAAETEPDEEEVTA